MSKLFKKMLLPVMAVFVLVVFNAYLVEAKSLKKGDVYRLLNGRETMEVISSSELEMTEGGQTILAEYDFKGDKLRVVANVIGTKMVKYYLLINEGLKEEKTGEVYYSKAGLVALEEKRKKEKLALKLALEKQGKKVLEELKASMVLVKGGCYQMGDTFEDGDEDGKPPFGGAGKDEKPVHEVCLDDFYMGKYEVTQIQWWGIMGDNPSKFKDCDTCPVESVSWDDAQEFINKLNQKAGKKYRLPTETEWEYAARTGGKKEKWAGTSNGSELKDYAWYSNNSTHPVGQKKPNGLGLYDMTGNVTGFY